MCEHCIGCFFRDEDGGMEPGFLNPDNPVGINYSAPACKYFALSGLADAERRRQPGEP